MTVGNQDAARQEHRAQMAALLATARDEYVAAARARERERERERAGRLHPRTEKTLT